MNAQTEIDLAKLHAAIVADIKFAFPQFRTVEFYREETEGGRALPEMPACLLELDEFEGAPDIDPGTGQLAVQARFAARIMIGFRTPDPKVAVRTAAAGLAGWLRLRRWFNPTGSVPLKLPTGPAEVRGAWRDDFDPRLDRCEVWRVEWDQAIHLGEAEDWNGPVPSQILFSWVPLIGAANEPNYSPLPVIV